MPYTLTDIRNKVRRITGRPTASQITDSQIDEYINTAYTQDLPAQLKLENLRINYQFVTSANQPVYDFPKDLYLELMPPVFIAGYQCYMTQSRQEFLRIFPEINQLQTSVATGIGATGPYSFILTNIPLMRGWKQNPPGAYDLGTTTAPALINWNVVISGIDNNGLSVTLVDDGQGSLFDPGDADTTIPRGTVDYITGVVAINAIGFKTAIALGSPINAQYVPYKASRPRVALFFQDQIQLYPVPDQAYTVSFECYQKPTALSATAPNPNLQEWWQLIAYLASDKIFSDNADMDNLQKFRPLLEEQLKLVQRRTIIQQSSDRAQTIYNSVGPGIGWPYMSPYSY
jgi:hypothetical protein